MEEEMKDGDKWAVIALMVICVAVLAAMVALYYIDAVLAVAH